MNPGYADAGPLCLFHFVVLDMSSTTYPAPETLFSLLEPQSLSSRTLEHKVAEFAQTPIYPVKIIFD